MTARNELLAAAKALTVTGALAPEQATQAVLEVVEPLLGRATTMEAAGALREAAEATGE